MKKVILCLFCVSILLFAGCQGRDDASVAEADFSFNLPEGYSISNITETECSVLFEETEIGGIVFTELTPRDIRDTGDRELHLYINSYGPVPLICEYIAMFFEEDGKSHISVTMKITDPDTGVIENTQRYIFERENAVYDLWLNNDLVDDEQRKEILRAAGIL